MTRVVGAVLVALGVLAYAGTGFAHPTALYRAVLGLVILVLGALASREALPRHMIHAALVVALPTTPVSSLTMDRHPGCPAG